MSSIQNIQETMNEFSLEELLTIIATATVAAKKKAKIVEKAPKEAKEKKGSMPKETVERTKTDEKLEKPKEASKK